MSEAFVGEIRMFGGNFAPTGWALCDGQLLAVSSNDALFSLLGTLYGGDGRTTFGLPDLRGRVPIHAGSGPGLTPRALGLSAGSETATVTVNQLPAHTHADAVSTSAGTQSSPDGQYLGASPNVRLFRPTSAPPPPAMDASTVTNTGGGQSHDNIMPFQCVNFIIALFGIYPSQT